MTLTELLVATILIGIVMLGAVSIDYVIRRSHKSASSSGRISVNTAAAMSQISNDAINILGHYTDTGTAEDDIKNRGVNYSPLSNGRETLCFRRPDSSSPTPENYDDDSWVCYSHDSDWILKRCDGIDSGTTTPNGYYDPANCSADAGKTARTVLDLKQETNPNNAAAFSIEWDDPASPNPRIRYIGIRLKSCSDSTDTDENPNPILNPCTELQSEINPIGLSR